jgi:hypothetical protein
LSRISLALSTSRGAGVVDERLCRMAAVRIGAGSVD